MKIMVDVLRAEQSWDLATHKQQNYLVLEVFGIEVRVPCSEEELVRAVSAVGATHPAEHVPESEDPAHAEAFTLEDAPEDMPVRAPSTFVDASDAGDVQERAPARPESLKPRTRKLAPVGRRPRGDDVGIAQG